MKLKHGVSLFFFLLLVLVPSAYSTGIQESAMLPKYLALSLLVFLTLLVFFKSLLKVGVKIPISSLFLVAYVFFSSGSIATSFNGSEALLETSKIALFAFTYYLVSYQLRQSREKSIRAISTFSMLAIGLAILFMLGELSQSLKSRAPFGSTVYLINGLHGHKNLLASWLMLLIPLSLMAYPLQTKTWKKWKFGMPMLAFIAVIILQSRATYTGIFAGIFAFTLLYFSTKKEKYKLLPARLTYAFIGIGALSILLLLLSPILENVLASSSIGSASANERFILWEKTIGLIKENPLWGIGGGNWKFVFPSQGLDGLYRAELNNVVFIRPHNDFLWIWVEHGLFSFLSFLGFIFFLVISGLKKIQVRQEGWEINSIAIAGLCAYLAMSFFDFPKERMEHQVAFAILLALIGRPSNSEKEFTLQPWLHKSALILSISLLGLFVFQGMERFKAETHLKKLLSHKENGENQAIIAEANQINLSWIQVDNNAVPIDWYKGNALFNSGNQEEAFRCYTSAAELNPYNFNVLNNIGVMHFINKEYEIASDYFKAALKINPKYDDSRLNLTSVYINLSQWDLAKQTISLIQTNSQRSENLKNTIRNR